MLVVVFFIMLVGTAMLSTTTAASRWGIFILKKEKEDFIRGENENLMV